MLSKILIRTLSLVVAGLISGRFTDAASPVIKSVTIASPASNPTVTITGTGFGTLPPVYVVNPYGYTGVDFDGYDLCFNAPAWEAGVGVPGLHAANAIGLVVAAYSNTAITYQFGSAYNRWANWPPLQDNQQYYVTVYGVQVGGTVHFGQTEYFNTPEPASVTLLGLGGLAMLLRRNR